MVDVARAHVLAVLTRAPSAGGKSRLFAALGRPSDPACLAALLLDTLEAARRPGLVRVVAVEPAAACAEVGRLAPPDVLVMPQAAGSLGDRMRGLFDALFHGEARAVVLVGSDLPDLAPGLIDEAFARLAREPDTLVLGPARDGGYYLIGATRTPDVFDRPRWGGPRVLADTLEAARAAGQGVHLLDPWGDVDTPDDLERVLVRSTPAAGADRPLAAAPAARTRAWARRAGIRS